MKIAVTTVSNNFEAQLDPRFGRCAYFLIVDSDTGEFKSFENKGAHAGSGAGIQAAKIVIDQGVKAVITGNVGPKAFTTLKAAGINVFTNVSGSVSEVMDKWQSGTLKSNDAPSVQSHHGMFAESQTPSAIKRIAVASEDNRGLDAVVSSHFGRCPYYSLLTVEGDHIKEVEPVENLFYDAHGQPGQVPGFIRDQKADVIIAGGMGQRAVGFFEEFGIEVVTGAAGTVSAVVQGYLNGTIEGAAPCKHESCH